ncbi:unnamed protein product [Durusdinium trenchii]|uniref:RING-type domain-containing protein n=1 Tax=Durusdinium trenchii TaxID=1381693 RepID=A0ABP0Q6E6_9DINO
MKRLLAVSLLLSVFAKDRKDCKHGEWDASSESCNCYEGWTKSGIADTVNFLAGVCDQYKCISDEKCESHVGIPGATCPIEGWNCYCGWEYAMKNDGHGFETKGKGGGACMGGMFTFSVWATTWVELFMMHTWKAFLLGALICLPFGRKRVNCDHHMPSLWRSLRELMGAADCHGECMQVDRYTWTTFKDDVAWSLYVLDLAFWAYAFLLVTWAVTLFVWSILLWAMVLLALLGMLVAGVCATCGEGAGGVDCGNCNCACDGCGVCDCSGCTGATATPGSVDFFYWGGPYPYYDCQCAPAGDCDGCCNCGCSWRCCCACCLPIAWMLFVFPRLPENAWGGLVGRLCGTHALTAPERLYQGGNCFVEFLGMSWRRGSDLHADAAWREAVYNFLAPGRSDESEVGGAQPRPLVQADGTLRNVVPIGRNGHAILIERPFDKKLDACVESSFADYAENKCWICQDDQHCEFDLWLGCHHIFCSKCSTEMLKRNMPCPLCRIASTSVLRGNSLGPRIFPFTVSPKSSRTTATQSKGNSRRGALLAAPAGTNMS